MTAHPDEADEVVLLWELVQTAHVAGLVLRDIFADEGLTPTQFGVLACLVDGDDFTKAELARALMVRPQSMDPLIESLLAAGLVRRDGPPRRGRAAGITITDDGRAAVARARPRVTATNDVRVTGVPAELVPQLAEHLRVIRTRLAAARGGADDRSVHQRVDT